MSGTLMRVESDVRQRIVKLFAPWLRASRQWFHLAAFLRSIRPFLSHQRTQVRIIQRQATAVGHVSPFLLSSIVANEEQVTAYQVHHSPIRSAIFDAGLTSRINVGHFMADLITDDETWNKWKGQMPVIYNKPSS